MRYTKVEVIRGETSTVIVEVGAWEIPVLNAIYGRDNVKVIGHLDVDDARRPWPESVDGEWERLTRRYGNIEKGSELVSLVSEVFGGDSEFARQRLADALEAEKEAARKDRAAKADPLAA